MSTPKERGILFTDPMVRAILDGRKTETRRVVRWPDWVEDRESAAYHINQRGGLGLFKDGRLVRRMTCPYDTPGDRLWVREAWQYAGWTEDGEPWIRYRADGEMLLRPDFPEEWAERLLDIWADLSDPANRGIGGRSADRRWRSARYMPRWASRITLEVQEVRLEQLHSIDEEGAKAEGCVLAEGFEELAVASFREPHREVFIDLWDSIHGSGSWDANPWVWVIRFRRLS